MSNVKGDKERTAFDWRGMYFGSGESGWIFEVFFLEFATRNMEEVDTMSYGAHRVGDVYGHNKHVGTDITRYNTPLCFGDPSRSAGRAPNFFCARVATAIATISKVCIIPTTRTTWLRCFFQPPPHPSFVTDGGGGNAL